MAPCFIDKKASEEALKASMRYTLLMAKSVHHPGQEKFPGNRHELHDHFIRPFSSMKEIAGYPLVLETRYMVASSNG